MKGEQEEFGLSIFNAEKMAVQRIDKKTLEEGLREVASAANMVATRLASIQNYKLKTFDISVGASATNLIVTINGGISLHFEKP